MLSKPQKTSLPMLRKNPRVRYRKPFYLNLTIEETKKDTKGKKEEKEEVKEEVIIKDFPKQMDVFYLLSDYPATKEEFAALSKLDLHVDSIYQIDLKIDLEAPPVTVQVEEGKVAEDLQARLDEFGEHPEQEAVIEARKHYE